MSQDDPDDDFDDFDREDDDSAEDLTQTYDFGRGMEQL